MYRRKIEDELISWKNSDNKKALVIKGLRQIGKTYSALKFAKENYENVIYINFKENESAKKIFDGDLNVDRITIDLSALILNVNFVPGKTIIVFDEIQECANARTSLKPFVIDGRYDVIATGSLLGIKGYNLKKGKGIPTGYEKIIYMEPMDFEEFLWAKGINEKVIDYLRDSFKNYVPINEAVHKAMFRYFNEYICVGGMPRIVDTFIKTNDMNAVYDEQHDLIEEYKDDFGKHLDENENEVVNKSLLGRINRVFDSIPSQLAKENKKFTYSTISKHARSNEYEAAIQWLIDFGLVVPCYNLSTIDRPLQGYKIDDVFKLYFKDSGLFVSLLEKGSAYNILSGQLNIYKGAIYENIIADVFSKNKRKLYYFHKDSGLEIDFVTVIDDKTSIIEVKATTGNTKAAKTVLGNKSKYNVDQLIKFGEYNIGKQDNIITLPYYLAFLIN